MKRIAKWVGWTLGGVIGLLVLAVVAVQVVLMQVPGRRVEIQQRVNQASGLDLRLGKLRTRWTLSGPELFAAPVEVFAPDQKIRLARAREITLSVDLWRMVSRAQLLAGKVRLVEPQVRFVRKADGTIELEGQDQLKHDDSPLDSDSLPSGSLDIVNGYVSLVDAEDGQTLVQLPGLRLRLVRNRNALGFSGRFGLTKALGQSFDFDGRVAGRLDDAKNLSWQAAVRGRDLHLPAWRSIFAGQWQKLNPEGELDVLDLSVSKTPGVAPKVKGTMQFAGVGFESVGHWPGVRNLSGSVEASEHSGVARLNGQAMTLSMPYRFRTPLPVDSFDGEIGWEHVENTEGGGWRLFSAKQLRVDNPHAHGVVDVDLFMPSNREISPVMKLRGQFHDIVLKEGWRYLPIDKLRNEKTIAWLDAAFLSGTAPTAEIVFDGPTRKFPFREGGGEFRVTFPTEGLNMHYGTGWRDIENLAADIEFLNQGLSGKVRSGKLNGLEIQPGSIAEFPDLSTGELSVRGSAKGDLNSAVTYLQRSPVGPSLGETFMQLRGQGPASADIDLFLPVKHLTDRKVKVAVRFEGSRAKLDGAEHTLRNLRGLLKIEDKELTASGLTASYLGGTMRIDLTPEKSRRLQTTENVVRVRARTPAPEFAQTLHVPEAIGLSGIVDWRATLRMPIAPPAPEDEKKDGKAEKPFQPITLRVESTLRGTGINMPAPMNKGIDETRPLRVDVRWPTADLALVRAAYGDTVKTQIEIARTTPSGAEESDWQLTRGAVQLGGAEPRIAGDGLRVAGSVDSLDLTGVLGMRSGHPGKRPLSSYLRSVEISARTLDFYGFRWNDISGTMAPGERSWVVTVDGAGARGNIGVPFDMDSGDPLTIMMDKLVLVNPPPQPQEAAADNKNESSADPRRWPAIKATVREFEAWNKKFGTMRAQLGRVPAGLELRSFIAQSSTFTLTGTGSWIVTPGGGQTTGVSLKLDSSDVMQTLHDLGYGESLTGKRGHAQLDLNWPGAPDGRLLSKLNGDVSIEVDNGQLVSVQPGAGRMFGLMSVTALRRRMALDFSDMTDKGLAFDSIRGDFNLKSGNAFTNNLLLKGPAADIGVVGRTGLDSRDYDQTAVVTGNVGGSLAAAGALAAGPAIGAAVLVLSQLFKQPLKGIARGYYRITGPWDDPTVQRVDAADGKRETAQEQQRSAGQS